MINSHLHILHLPPITGRPNLDKVSEVRLKKLLHELEQQSITDYTIIEGFYDRRNTKKAIHLGHRRMVQLAKEQGMENVVIAEDDIVFTSPDSYAYFIGSIPKSYDLYCGLIYAGKVENNRIVNGASGIMTLYSIHSRFYDFFLSLNPDTHIDREIGGTAYRHEYYVCPEMVCVQRGGFSFNLHQQMHYAPYMQGKKFYGHNQGEVFREGIWSMA